MITNKTSRAVDELKQWLQAEGRDAYEFSRWSAIAEKYKRMEDETENAEFRLEQVLMNKAMTVAERTRAIQLALKGLQSALAFDPLSTPPHP